MNKTIAMISILMISGYAGAEQPAKTPVEKAVAFYNSFERDEALSVMRASASPADAAYLDLIRAKTKSERLPRARAEGNSFYIQGLEKPVMAEDLSKGVFSYNGRRFILDFSKEFRVNVQVLEENLRPQQYSWMTWVVPQAHASFDMEWALVAAGVIGGGATAYYAEDTTTKMIGAGVLGASVMGGLWKYNSDKRKREEERRNWRYQQMAGYYGPPMGPIAYPTLPGAYPAGYPGPQVMRAPAAVYPAAAIPVTSPYSIQTITQGAGAAQ